MKYSKDFFYQINDHVRLTTVQVIYRMPDYLSLLQEFIWQTLDSPPDYQRIHEFLQYWEDNIEAPIHSVKIASVETVTSGVFKTVDKYYKL
jgi:uncharacterized protein Usg